MLINPEIIGKERVAERRRGLPEPSRFRETGDAGEESDGARVRTPRAKPFEMTGEDLLARAFLHETDHLNGTLYISHISPLKRDLIRRKVRKLQKADEWG